MGQPLQSVLRRIRKVLMPPASGVTDAELLTRFVAWRDEAAFELLLRRYEKLVFAVCRRVLHHEHDAEDAFQATFLVLAQKAAAISRREALASWLTRVAFRIAVRAGGKPSWIAVRSLEGVPESGGLSSQSEPHIPNAALFEELDRLPAKYRAPVVLCYLDGKTHAEAARQLGWPKGTVASRLARAKERLRSRLTCRGVTLPAAGMAAALQARAEAFSPPLTQATLRAALGLADGSTAGLIKPAVLSLMEGALKAMFVNQLKVAAAWVLVVVLAAGGAGVLAYRVQAGTGGTALAQDGPAQKDADFKKELRQLQDLDAQTAVITRLTNDRIQAQAAAQGAHDRVQLLQKQLDDSQGKKPAEVGTPIKREELRYDGKTFADWQKELRTELKAQLRADAMRAMGEFGANGYAREAVAVILDVMKGYDIAEGLADDDNMFEAADRALGKIGPSAGPLLAEGLKSKNLNVRRFAALALSSFHYDTVASLGDLITSTRDEDLHVRRAAVVALRKHFDKEGTMAAVIERLKDKNGRVRHDAARSLEEAGAAGAAAVPALLDAMKDPIPDVRRAAMATLFALKTDPKRLLPALLEAMKDENNQFRWEATHLVERVATEPKLVIPALAAALKDHYPNVRQDAVRALGKFGPEAKDAVPALIAAFDQVERGDRLLIARALGQIGPAAKDAVPLLMEAALSGDGTLKDAAAEALKRIKGDVKKP